MGNEFTPMRESDKPNRFNQGNIDWFKDSECTSQVPSHINDGTRKGGFIPKTPAPRGAYDASIADQNSEFVVTPFNNSPPSQVKDAPATDFRRQKSDNARQI